MIRAFQFAAAVLAASLLCSPARTQRRGGVASVGMSSARLAPASRASFATAAPFAAPRTIGQFRSIRLLPGGQVTPAFSTFTNSVWFRSVNRATAFGTGSQFSAAPSNGGVRGNLNTNLGRGRRGQTLLGPIVIAGYPYYYYGDTYDDSSSYAQPPQQGSMDQQPGPGDAVQQDAGSGNDLGAPSTISQAPAAAVPDVGEFVLVRRDGGILFASAFSVVRDQLRYITPEGIRRSVAMADLDAAATQQMNEARGTTVQLHE
jgi:hypothetical protein